MATHRIAFSLTLLFCISVIWAADAGAPQGKLAELAALEKHVVQTTESYATEELARLRPIYEALEAATSEWRLSQQRANGTAALASYIGARRLLRRARAQYQHSRTSLNVLLRQLVSFNRQLPYLFSDLMVVLESLCSIRRVYNISIDELDAFRNFSCLSSQELRPSDLAFMGIHSQFRSDPFCGRHFLEKAYSSWKDMDPAHDDDDLTGFWGYLSVLDYYSFVAYQTGDCELALKLNREYKKLDQSNERINKNEPFLATCARNPNVIPEHDRKKPKSRTAFEDKCFKAFCGEENLEKLTCEYKSFESPLFAIMPARVEWLSRRPPLIRIYDFLSPAAARSIHDVTVQENSKTSRQFFDDGVSRKSATVDGGKALRVAAARADAILGTGCPACASFRVSNGFPGIASPLLSVSASSETTLFLVSLNTNISGGAFVVFPLTDLTVRLLGNSAIVLLTSPFEVTERERSFSFTYGFCPSIAEQMWTMRLSFNADLMQAKNAIRLCIGQPSSLDGNLLE